MKRGMLPDISQPEHSHTKVRYIVVDAAHEGRRIDNYLSAHLKSLPASRLYSMLRRGEVRVDGRRVKPTYRLVANDKLRLPPMHLATSAAHRKVNKQFLGESLYEDERFLVINKPAGIAVHGGTGLTFGLVESLRAMRPDLDYLELAHRLDRGTSGCLLFAKSMPILRQLHTLFRENKVRKRYIALVHGKVPSTLKHINAPLRRRTSKSGMQENRPTMVFDPAGKISKTEISIKQHIDIAGNTYSLIEALPLTGRTHQIRAHLAHSGYAVAGDDQYRAGNDPREIRKLGLKRLFLHAMSLSIETLDGVCYNWKAPLPKTLNDFLERHTKNKSA